MSNLESKHLLFASVEQMLSPETLSELLSKPINHVERSKPAVWGNAGSEFSHIETDSGRLILKTMSRAKDWLTFATNDSCGRSVMLWQHGLLDELCSDLGHTILGCAHENGVWAILMADLSGRFLWEDSQELENLAPVYLDALARLHARFWNDSRLQNARLGLGGPDHLLQIADPAFAQEHMSDRWSWVPEGCIEGWKILNERLEADVFLAMKQLIETPRPLLEAINRCPYTLLHGDYYVGNLAHGKSGKPIAVDWQLAMCSLMTIDLARITNSIYTDVSTRLQGQSYYRRHLEGYLNMRFDNGEWQAMVDLGSLVDVLWLTCLAAYWMERSDDNSDARRWGERRLALCTQQVRDGIRWL